MNQFDGQRVFLNSGDINMIKNSMKEDSGTSS